MSEILHHWASNADAVTAGQAISIDGKAFARSVKDCQGQQQDLVTVVSACVQQWDGVLAQVRFQHGQSRESASVGQWLDGLDGQGVWITIAALHTPKNGL